ncbi:uncharacterized protein BXZ73DRAFT_52820, partial [Epithele typhae]|uniref:uncharacterized protein n=1 Tax=Epithele typhae TaxID=378194 RepID=UPI002008DBBD
MIQHVHRLKDSKTLGYALIQFPHLIRHRHLLMQKGAIPFLEGLLKSWYTAPWSFLNDDNRQGVFSTIRALALLVSEFEVDGDDSMASRVREGVALDHTPFLPFKRGKDFGPVTFSLDTHKILISLLAAGPGEVPLSLVGFCLRLSTQFSEMDRIGRGVYGRVEEFLSDVVTNPLAAMKTFAQVLDTVNTVLFLAFFETAHPLVHVSSPLLRPRNTRYWFTMLLNVMKHVPMDSEALRQLCWGLCALSWARSPQANGVVIRPMIPRLDMRHNVARSLAELLSCDQDPGVLKDALSAIEHILWHLEPSAAPLHRTLCNALHWSYPHFVAEAYKRFVKRRLPMSMIADLIGPMTRISAFLSFFDRGSKMASGPRNSRIQLTSTVLSIMLHFI